jgi:hypothetical protein
VARPITHKETDPMFAPKNQCKSRKTKVMVESLEDRLALDGSRAAFITSVYEDVLDRAPTPAELSNWTSQLQKGVSDTTFATALVQSPEHRGLEVEDIFEQVMHAKADAASLTRYVNELEHGKTEDDVMREVIDSAPFQQAHASNTSFVQGLFQAVLGRAPTPSELQSDVNQLNRGTSRDSLVRSTIRSPAHEGEVVDKAFEEVLRRGDTKAEHDKDVSDLCSGRLNDDNLLIELIGSPENELKHGGGGGPGGGGSGKH